MRSKLLNLILLLLGTSAYASQSQLTHEVPEPVDLLEGAKWAYSMDGGKTFSDGPVAIAPEETVDFIAKTIFTVEDPATHVALELRHGFTIKQLPKFVLNGKVVSGPLEGMFYRTIPAIDVKRLREGSNTLEISASVANRSSSRRKGEPLDLTPQVSLRGLLPEHLRFQTGPILGAIDESHFSVTCRTNLPVKVILYRVEGTPSQRHPAPVKPVRIASSGPALIHRFKVPENGGGEFTNFVLTARCDNYYTSVPVNRPAKPNDFMRFVAMCDSRSHPDDWTSVADAVVKARPNLIIFAGDMVSRGTDDWEWDNEFFGPARELFATIPVYAVIGNHEKNAPVYNELFYTPGGDGRSRNWAQEIGGVLLIGIDGLQDWSAGSENAKWLEETLAGSDAKFIFFTSHYPAWTSGRHGRMDESGKPVETAVREGQEVIFPLLTRYRATAMIAGHDHIYERSEHPGGVTMIITGGAGAPLRGKHTTHLQQNPYSKVFHSKLHYCLFDVRDDTCTMKVLTPEGELLDTRTWKARTTSNH